jgi:hypothetical protein
MRVAIIALLALAALVGSTLPAAASCGSHPPVPNPLVPIACALGIGCGTPELPPVAPPTLPPGSDPLASIINNSTTTNNTTTNNTTNNFITNNFITQAQEDPQGTTTTAAAGGATTPTATPTAFAFPPSAGGGGAGGGGIGGGGGFGGSSSVGGMPINPSSDYVYTPYASGSGGSSGGGGGVSGGDPIALASLGGAPMGGGTFAMASSDTEPGPLTAGVTMASLPAAGGGSDDTMTVAMASPRTTGSASPDGSAGFGLEGPASAAGPIASGFGGTTMLAALIGVGVLGAGWAWRSLVV